MYSNCVFCNISSNLNNQKNLIQEKNHVFIIPDIKPRTKGHALVITKKHFVDLSSSDDEAIAEAIISAKEYANELSYKDPTIKGFNFLSNQGAAAEQVVFHFHLHVIPRY